jgi:hypothetical protein
VQPLDFTASKWFKDNKEKLETEDRDYEEFLNSLDDGTE